MKGNVNNVDSVELWKRAVNKYFPERVRGNLVGVYTEFANERYTRGFYDSVRFALQNFETGDRDQMKIGVEKCINSAIEYIKYYPYNFIVNQMPNETTLREDAIIDYLNLFMSSYYAPEYFSIIDEMNTSERNGRVARLFGIKHKSDKIKAHLDTFKNFAEEMRNARKGLPGFDKDGNIAVKTRI